jgi:chromosome segregation ATPase
MAELSKGFNDEHMNAEALAELAKSQDLMSGLDEVEKKLAQGDVEGAMKALDQMASSMDRMLAGLSRTAGMPDEKARALMKEMLAFKEQLEKLEKAQQGTAAETEQLRGEYRKRVADRLKNAEAALKKLQDLARSAREDVDGARNGVTQRAQPDYEVADDALKDLERALSMRELEGANDAVRRAQPSVDRLSQVLREDASLGLSAAPLTGRQPSVVDGARRKIDDAAPKVQEIRDQLAKLFPDPRSVMSQEEQKRLGDLSRKQRGLEDQAEALQKRLSELSEQAPVFPPSAQAQLGESRGHMGQAAAELGNRNPQRGRGEQDLALDALGRFKKGLEDAARKQQGQSGGGGEGFPFPFAESGDQQGDGFDPSREKVKIPGAEAHKVPEEFRRDLLEAMKQGTPERYRGDVQKYYEELVK